MFFDAWKVKNYFRKVKKQLISDFENINLVFNPKFHFDDPNKRGGKVNSFLMNL